MSPAPAQRGWVSLATAVTNQMTAGSEEAGRETSAGEVGRRSPKGMRKKKLTLARVGMRNGRYDRRREGVFHGVKYATAIITAPRKPALRVFLTVASEYGSLRCGQNDVQRFDV
ncbi:hypothetical protein EVAR_66782_1 [Eumeta japonica]|uniref:Uncharacterized protein n=1 Tax=Eumeta variegata TaxID=151549 RepID=A0A4C1ZHH5_EUMVA|nr:hypothetical protein EVAR_66782_1 [Eumeta japonica]